VTFHVGSSSPLNGSLSRRSSSFLDGSTVSEVRSTLLSVLLYPSVLPSPVTSFKSTSQFMNNESPGNDDGILSSIRLQRSERFKVELE